MLIPRWLIWLTAVTAVALAGILVVKEALDRKEANERRLREFGIRRPAPTSSIDPTG